MSTGYPSGRYLLDACCLVKLLVPEQGAATRRLVDLLDQRSPSVHVLTSASAVVETFGVLKAKRRQKRPDHISQAQYLFGALSIVDLTRERRIRVFDPRIGWEAFQKVVAQAHAARLDVLDALQLELMRRLANTRKRSPAVLVTTDKRLYSTAVAHGVAVWNPDREGQPKSASVLARRTRGRRTRG